MTQRERKLIVNYWLWKRWMEMRPETMKRFLMQMYRRRLLSFLICVGILGYTVSVFAAEVKTEQPTGLFKMLSSKDAGSREKVKSEKAKPKFTLPDPDPDDLKAEGESKSAQGAIVAKNKYGMAVEYDFNAEKGASSEIWVKFHSKMKLTGFKELKQLEEGDVVLVQYKITKETKRIFLQSITFISKKAPEIPQEFLPKETPQQEVKVKS